MLNIGNVVSGSAALPTGVSTTYIFARATGYLVPSVTGLYTIGLNYSDGANLFIGSTALFSNLAGAHTANSSAAYISSGQIQLTAGIYYPIVIEWQHGSGANYELQLLWTPPTSSVALIPSANLSISEATTTSSLNVEFWNGTILCWYPTGAGVVPFGFTGAWSATVEYVAGDEVTYAGQFWKCVTANLNSAPTLSNPNWQNVGATVVGLAAYASGTTYYVNNQVTYNGNVYTALGTTTGNLPTNATYWVLVGPATLDAVANGTNYLKGTAAAAPEGIIGNGNFTLWDSNGFPSGWVNGGPAFGGVNTIASQGGAPYSGAPTPVHINSAVQWGGISFNQQFPVTPGDVYKIAGWIYSVTHANAAAFGFNFLSASGAWVGNLLVSTTGAGAWQYRTASGSIPAGAAYAAFWCGSSYSGSSDVYFSGVNAWRVRSLDDEVSDGTVYIRPKSVNSSHLLGSAGATPIFNSGLTTSAGAILSSTMGSKTISVAAFTIQYGFGTVSYNSGSVTPGNYGTYAVYFSDPTYAGGTVTFVATTQSYTGNASDGDVILGSITTSSSSGGSGGGGGGGGGACFSGNVGVQTPEGFVRMDALPRSDTFYITNKSGTFPARLIVHENIHEVMLDMGEEELVTMGHVIKNADNQDVAAIEVFPDAPRVEFTGTVYNLEVFGEDHHYVLDNGVEAHNNKVL
jgi:hypothetical protein